MNSPTVTQQINHSDLQYVWTYIRYGCFFIDYFQLASNDQLESCYMKNVLILFYNHPKKNI